MTTAAQVIQCARGEVGYHETGGASNDGNITKYWQELDHALQGEPWCAAFVSWVFKHAGKPLPAIDKPYGYVGCEDAHQWARQHGMLDTSGHYRPGDAVLFSWSANGRADHTGILVSDDGHAMRTIEGNTASGYTGDQRNGGCVAEKVRYHGPTVIGVVSFHRLLASAPTAKPSTDRRHTNPHRPPTHTLRRGVDDHPYMGVAWVQWAVAVAEDGDFGRITDAHVRAFQRSHRLSVDGIVGPNTRAAMSRVTR